MNTETLKTEIEDIVSALKKDGKIHLAKCIEENWSKTCLEYSKNINSYTTEEPLENIMERALTLELERLDHSKSEIEKIIDYLKKHRILQTTPHISPAQKPRYFFTNWLGSLALTKKEFYPIAMFSGVPFSNKTRPGRLCSKNNDINLIPSNLQDELVYRSEIPEKMVDVIQNLPTEIQKLLPKAIEGESYTKWAMQACQNIEEKYLNGKPIFFDFNEVIANYILLAIKEKNHPIYEILFMEKEREELARLFAKEVFFYGETIKGKYKIMESFILKNGYLESTTRTIKLEPEILEKEIKENHLCPGLPLGFLIFTFLNHFKCFGSFAQTEYLPMYKNDFMRIPCLKQYNLINAPTLDLTTTGGFPENTNLHPLDLYLGEQLKTTEDILFGETIVAIKDVLLHQNYSLNMIKSTL